MRVVRILLSAYACEPNIGSEQGKGWNFALELANLGHEVVVLTCGSHHREPIERWLAAGGILPPNLTFVWHDPKGRPGPGYKKARGIRIHYTLWQITARDLVRRLHAERPFDVIHHVSWTVLRWPTFLGGLGPKTIFGPVGGGERCPVALREGFSPRAWLEEVVRDGLNGWARIDPLQHWGLRGVDTILVTDEATRRAVPRWCRGRAQIWCDTYAPVRGAEAPLRSARPSGTPLRAVVCARQEYWKGVHLAIGAIGLLEAAGLAVELTILGHGRDEADFAALAEQAGITARIRRPGHVPLAELPKVLAAHDVLLFPSLHDSGALSIGESMAVGLPVICLDRGGPPVVVDESCGFRVPTAGRSRQEVEATIALHLAQLSRDDALLARLSAGASARAGRIAFAPRVRALAEAFYEPLQQRQPQRRPARGLWPAFRRWREHTTFMPPKGTAAP